MISFTWSLVNFAMFLALIIIRHLNAYEITFLVSELFFFPCYVVFYYSIHNNKILTRLERYGLIFGTLIGLTACAFIKHLAGISIYHAFKAIIEPKRDVSIVVESFLAN